jgi:hypothetical protein
VKLSASRATAPLLVTLCCSFASRPSNAEVAANSTFRPGRFFMSSSIRAKPVRMQTKSPGSMTTWSLSTTIISS